VVQEPHSPGKLDVEAAKPLLERNRQALQLQGVKNPLSLLSKLKNKEVVPLPDGTQLNPIDFLGPDKPGKKIVILGDTSDPWSMKDISLDCDMLIHEATNAKTSEDGEKTFEEVESMAKEHGHSTPQMAAAFAREVRARHLVLTHFSQRYKGDEEEESLKMMQEIIDLANSELKDSATKVTTARDLMLLSI